MKEQDEELKGKDEELKGKDKKHQEDLEVIENLRKELAMFKAGVAGPSTGNA